MVLRGGVACCSSATLDAAENARLWHRCPAFVFRVVTSLAFSAVRRDRGPGRAPAPLYRIVVTLATVSAQGHQRGGRARRTPRPGWGEDREESRLRPGLSNSNDFRYDIRDAFDELESMSERF